MKRTLVLILAGIAAAAVFGMLVHTVLVAAHLSQPAETTVHGLTVRRLLATSVAGLALVGVILGGLSLARPAGRFGSAPARVATVVAGLLAAVGGALVLAIADGGPGSGNGVVGGAAALVLGLIATALGALARSRKRGLTAMPTA